jgi:D-aminoacyl-tRNA deacylase
VERDWANADLFAADGAAGISRSGTLDFMRAVTQRVTRAQVTVDGEVTAKIANGLLVLLGVAKTDTPPDADYLAGKIVGLRIFEDENGKMNLAVGGRQWLSAGGFAIHTLRRCPPGASVRPSMTLLRYNKPANSMKYFVERIRAAGLPCETAVSRP